MINRVIYRSLKTGGVLVGHNLDHNKNLAFGNYTDSLFENFPRHSFSIAKLEMVFLWT